MRPDSTVHWKAYPALLLAGCLAAGIGLAARLPAPFELWGAGCAAAGLVLAAGLLHKRRRLVTLAPLARMLAAGAMVAALGSALYSSSRLLPAHHVAHRVAGQRAPHRVLLEGRVTGAPEALSYGTRFTVEARRLADAQDTSRVTGRVQVMLAQPFWGPEQAFPPIRQGDVVRVRGELEPVPPRLNPADFDYGAYLQRRGIYALLTTYQARDVSWLRREHGWAERLVVPARRYVGRQIERRVRTGDARAVLRALLLGDRSRIGEDTRDRFVRTGLLHLLAISGLHVLLVGMIIYRLLQPMLLRLRLRWRTMQVARAAVTMTVLVFYMLLAGARPSVVRAVVMAGLLIGGVTLQRSSSSLNALGVAALVLLLARPAQLFDAGFQLSFAAVAAIVTLNPVLQRRLPEWWMERGGLHGLVTTTVTSMAATLGTLPVLLYHFGYASFAGLLLNAAAIPLTGLALAASLLMVVLGGWFAFAAACFGAAAEACTHLLLWTAQAGDAVLSWASLRVAMRSHWALMACAAALVMLAQWPRPRLRWRLFVVALAFVTAGVWSGVLRGAHAPRLEVLFFSVGQGDAALVALPNGEHLLVDAGPRTPFTDEAERTILPHLRRYGIRRLSAVVISHPDADHLGGLAALLRSVPVGRVLHNGQRAASDLYAETRHLIDSLDVPYEAVRAGDTLRLSPSVAARVLAPAAGAGVVGNEASIVLRLVYGSTSVLFTGDAGRQVERVLLRRYGTLLASDVTKIGHHGSATSSAPAFVEHVVPETGRSWAVVSVGWQNAFGLPDRSVLRRWRAAGATVASTARGAVWLRSNGQRFERVRWR